MFKELEGVALSNPPPDKDQLNLRRYNCLEAPWDVYAVCAHISEHTVHCCGTCS